MKFWESNSDVIVIHITLETFSQFLDRAESRHENTDDRGKCSHGTRKESKAKHSENAPSGIVAIETSKSSHRNLDAIVHYTLSHI